MRLINKNSNPDFTSFGQVTVEKGSLHALKTDISIHGDTAINILFNVASYCILENLRRLFLIQSLKDRCRESCLSYLCQRHFAPENRDYLL